MTAPSRRVRDEVFKRDGYECVAGPVGCFGQLEWGHREASGQGGRGDKAPPLTSADGVAQCTRHNGAAEGPEQRRALEHGWKIKRFRGNPPVPASEIPYYVVRERKWYLPGEGADRLEVTPIQALDLLDAAGSIDEHLASDIDVREARLIRKIGYLVVMDPAEPVQIGSVVSRFEIKVFDPDPLQLVAVFRCTREGDWIGGGWVETTAGTRAVSRFDEARALLEGRRAAA